MREGQKVAYCGPSIDGLDMADRGEVVSSGDRADHVLFSTGKRKGDVVLVDHLDLLHAAPARKAVTASFDDLEDSLEVGTLAVTAAREIYEAEGEVGVLSTMAEAGHLTSFAAIAQEAHDLIQSRIRSDPSFRSVTAQLDDEESESVIRLATAVLMRDAFGVGE